MKGVVILLDTERFPKPQQHNVVLEAFFAIKDEILKTLKPLEEKTMSIGCIIIVQLKYNKQKIDYLIDDPKLKQEISFLLAEKMDLSKIAERIFSKDLN